MSLWVAQGYGYPLPVVDIVDLRTYYDSFLADSSKNVARKGCLPGLPRGTVRASQGSGNRKQCFLCSPSPFSVDPATDWLISDASPPLPPHLCFLSHRGEAELHKKSRIGEIMVLITFLLGL